MTVTSEQPKIIVVGSSSVDLVLDTRRLPKPNETVMADKVESFFGGKGANQSVAAARLGASVYFFGCVGMDPYGQQILRNLVDEGVNVGFVIESEDTATGTAYVTSAESQNTIIVVPASNYCLTADHITEGEKFFVTADVILLQLEVPMEVIVHSMTLAKNNNKKVGLYASPAKKLSPEIIAQADFIVAKSEELAVIFGDGPHGDTLTKYPNKLFIRDDSGATTYFDGAEMKYRRYDQESLRYNMGSGDAFTAAFAVALCHGNSVEDCVNFGNAYSVKASQKRGSQNGLPYLADFFPQ